MTTAQLAVGKYGSAEAILAKSAGWYEHLGVSETLSKTSFIHPILDLQLVKKSVRKNDETPKIEDSAPVEQVNLKDWSNRTHQYDEVLFSELSERAKEISKGKVLKDGGIKEITDQASTSLENSARALWENTQPFVSRAYLLDDPDQIGTTWDNMNGVILLGAKRCQDSRVAAESVLHEALHCKAARMSRSFENIFMKATNEFIEIPWWQTKAAKIKWDMDRAFAAFYVYAHLASYYSDRYATQNISADLNSFRRISFRATYLHNVLVQIADGWIDEERKDLLHWLSSTMPDPVDLSEAGKTLLKVDVKTFDSIYMVEDD